MSLEIEQSGRRAVLVVGMHRSGTSAMARIASLLGAELPADLMPPQPDNTAGFWESESISKFNEHLLGSALRRWDDPKPLEEDWFSDPLRQNQITLAAELLEAKFGTAPLVVIKDPRMARLLPLWRAALECSRVIPFGILVLRNPKEVAASLRARDRMRSEYAQLLWLTHMLAAERYTRGMPRLIVSYAGLLDDWRVMLSVAGSHPAFRAGLKDDAVGASIDEFLSARYRHQTVSDDEFLDDGRYSQLIKKVYRLLQAGVGGRLVDELGLDQANRRYLEAWETFSPGAGRSRVFDTSLDMTGPRLRPRLAGRRRELGSAGLAQSVKSVETPLKSLRTVILHYHLFKNAGTSVDRILQENFGDRWQQLEGQNAILSPQQIGEYLVTHPDVSALSSHTAMLPLPEVPDTRVFPVLFLRHPLDRVRSIYDFERLQEVDTEGARMAKQLDIAAFISWRLEREGDRSFRNFQTYRLAAALPERVRRTIGEFACAEAAIERLPFIGLVEQFDQSVQRLHTLLHPYGIDLKLSRKHENTTQGPATTLEERLDSLQSRIGLQLYEDLLAANELDLAIYRRVQEHFEVVAA